MSLGLTRKEWLERRKYVVRASGTGTSRSDIDRLATAILGPCPPEPPSWCRHSGDMLSLSVGFSADQKHIWVGSPHKGYEKLTFHEAEAMAETLVEHAHYIREQEANNEPPVCGRLLFGWGTCGRPKGHDDDCRQAQDFPSWQPEDERAN